MSLKVCSIHKRSAWSAATDNEIQQPTEPITYLRLFLLLRPFLSHLSYFLFNSFVSFGRILLPRHFTIGVLGLVVGLGRLDKLLHLQTTRELLPHHLVVLQVDFDLLTIHRLNRLLSSHTLRLGSLEQRLVCHRLARLLLRLICHSLPLSESHACATVVQEELLEQGSLIFILSLGEQLTLVLLIFNPLLVKRHFAIVGR